MPTTQRSQPPTPGAHPAPAKPPCPMRNVSEFAVADTPGTAWPEHAGAQNYFQARFVPIDTHDQPPPRPQASSRTQTQTQTQSHNQIQSQQQQQQGGGVPTALARGVVNGSGPTNATERQATRYVVPGEGEGQPNTKQNENVDAGPGQMEMYPEGRVADAVERSHRQGEGGQMQPQRRRQRRESVSVGVSGGMAGMAAGMGMGMDAGGNAGRGGSPAGQGLHGRGRGEVTLEKGEADLERKKQQQAAARKQVMDARKRGEDVDGRGTTGSSGRQPRAETD